MARRLEREKALRLRKQGKSYSEIKKLLGISKSTLSYWLTDFPLSESRIQELRDRNPIRIERYRQTMSKKREARIEVERKKVLFKLGKLNERDLYVGGFFLFWGEGTKRRSGQVALSNTDPAVIRFFIRWLLLLGAEKSKIHFVLHLYEDMDIKKETRFWVNVLGFPESAFSCPYIKKTKQADISYKTGFGHGTCNARYYSQQMNDYVRTGFEYIRGLYEPK
ncbi:MAG: helix-turn-helix domain-containing protein [Nanoarchaeota archaeon]